MEFERSLEKEQPKQGSEGAEKELSYEELSERWMELHAQNAKLTERLEREAAEEFGDLDTFSDRMEKDSVAQKMVEGMTAETPHAKKREQIESTKIPLMNMFGDAARLRKFMLQNETFKKLGASQEEWRNVSDRLEVMEEIRQAG